MNLYTESSKALRAAFESAKWWPVVQEDVRKQLFFLLDNLELLGPTFRDAFLSSFKYSNLSRMLAGKMSNINQPGALFGSALTDECYQCGKVAVKALLELNDWIEPTEADVQCCISLCNQIDRIETLMEHPTMVFQNLLPKVDAT